MLPLSEQNATDDQVEQFQQLILRWRADPVAYVREVFSVEPDPWQLEALTALASNDWLSIKSGHGVGKTALEAWVIFWFLTCFYPAKVPCTAPSSNQMFDVLWAELGLWLNKATPFVRRQFKLTSDRLQLITEHGVSESFASARTARAETPDALQGFHAENILFIVDEAAGVPDIIFETAMGALSTKGAKQLLCGNPTKAKGYFFNSHKVDSRFYKMTVSGVDSPRVSKEFLDMVVSEYGLDSQQWRYRVLGEFPTVDEDVVIPMQLVESAVNREINITPYERPVWGLDVARYGPDRSVLIKRYPTYVIDEPKVWRAIDTMELVGRVKHEWDETLEPNRPVNIYVDVIGLGAGVADRLLELGLPVIPVNVAESPALMQENVFRLRDELWIAALKWFQSRMVKLIKNTSLMMELTEVRKAYTSSGKIRIESKDDYKKRIAKGLSPDLADAFVLTFAYQAPALFAPVSTAQRAGQKPKPLSRIATYA